MRVKGTNSPASRPQHNPEAQCLRVFSMFDGTFMQHRWISLALSAAVALLGNNLCMAADRAAIAAAPLAASQSQTGAKKPLPPAKLVDINSASKAELKTLPGIGDAEADRIIKARPYASKAKLAVDKVIPEATYAGLLGKIVAMQPLPAKANAKADTKAAAKP